MKINRLRWTHIIAYGLSVIILVLIGIKLANYYKTKDIFVSEPLELRDLDIVFGDKSSNIAIYMYFSYDCIYCISFFSEVYPKLKQEFIDEGKVKLVMRLAVRTLNTNMQNALKTAVCINRFGYFDYLHQLLLTDSKVVFSPDFQDMINEFIDRDILVAECILGIEAEEYLNKNLEDVEKYGIKGTPTFIINRTLYQGYKDYDQFKKNLIEHLKN